MPRVLDHFLESLKLLRLPRAGLLTDLDGTLSEIVVRPEDAAVAPAVREALASLHRRLALVAIITGRAAQDALRIVGLEELTYVGNHGMERIEGGRHRVSQAFQPYLLDVRSAVGRLRATLEMPGVWVEDKELSISIHYRHAPDRQEAHRRIRRALRFLPNRDRFHIIEGKEVVNFLPAPGSGKGSALAELVKEHDLSGALFMGDDITDLDAFRSIRSLRTEGGFRGINVAVLGKEAKPEVEKEADFTLQDVAETSLFLTRLADNLA